LGGQGESEKRERNCILYELQPRRYHSTRTGRQP
jgi:hypothetical protein